jgi:hypothetical protein
VFSETGVDPRLEIALEDEFFVERKLYYERDFVPIPAR